MALTTPDPHPAHICWATTPPPWRNSPEDEGRATLDDFLAALERLPAADQKPIIDMAVWYLSDQTEPGYDFEDAGALAAARGRLRRLCVRQMRRTKTEDRVFTHRLVGDLLGLALELERTGAAARLEPHLRRLAESYAEDNWSLSAAYAEEANNLVGVSLGWRRRYTLLCDRVVRPFLDRSGAVTLT